MIGIKMKPNIPVHYQKGNTLQKGNPPLPTYNPLLLPPPIFISSPDPKGQVSYCHHLASVVVVRHTS